MNIYDVVCYIAAGAYGLAIWIYALAYWQGKVEPTLSTWIVWTILTGALLWAAYQVGGETALWPAWLVFIESSIILVITVWKCFRKGSWRLKFSLLDIACILGAVLSLVPWWLYRSETTTFYLDLGLSSIGAIPTIIESWRERKEHCLAWTLAVVSQLMYLAVAHNRIDFLYSSVILVIDVAIVLPLWFSYIEQRRQTTLGGFGKPEERLSVKGAVSS